MDLTLIQFGQIVSSQMGSSPSNGQSSKFLSKICGFALNQSKILLLQGPSCVNV